MSTFIPSISAYTMCLHMRTHVCTDLKLLLNLNQSINLVIFTTSYLLSSKITRFQNLQQLNIARLSVFQCTHLSICTP